MSLTQLLALPEVAARFDLYVRAPASIMTNAPPRLLVPPGHRSYALVGTAFDYCLRFLIAAHNPKLVTEQEWVAEIAPDLLAAEPHLPPGLDVDQVRRGLARARGLYQKFLHSKIFTRRLARAALYLAALDRAYRTGPETVEVRLLRQPLEAETEDCMRLVRAVPREMLLARERAVLNPTFGEASTLVGGADADFVIDDTLVDIKTTKYSDLKPGMLYQLVGYRMLLGACEPGGSTCCGAPVVTHGAIYFSRHAHLARFSYVELIDREDYLRLSRWFIGGVAGSSSEAANFISRIDDDAPF